jgi:hypothetical protein
MKENSHIITGYVMIRAQKVVANGKLLFESQAAHQAAVFTDIYKHFAINYPKFYKMDNLCKLGFLTSDLLLHNRNVNQQYGSDGTGIILYNASSSIDTDRNHQQSIHNRSSYFPSPSVFVYTLANIVIGEICIRNKFYGEGTFFIENEFNPVLLHTYVMQLFTDGVIKCCLTGWLESDGEHYDGVLYLVEKSDAENHGIAIFDPEKLNDIYQQRI